GTGNGRGRSCAPSASGPRTLVVAPARPLGRSGRSVSVAACSARQGLVLAGTGNGRGRSCAPSASGPRTLVVAPARPLGCSGRSVSVAACSARQGLVLAVLAFRGAHRAPRKAARGSARALDSPARARWGGETPGPGLGRGPGHERR